MIYMSAPGPVRGCYILLDRDAVRDLRRTYHTYRKYGRVEAWAVRSIMWDTLFKTLRSTGEFGTNRCETTPLSSP